MALTNQLRAELERFWPGPLGLFSDLDSLISLAFLERYPSPADAHGLGEQRLQAFLTRHRYTGRKQPAQLLAKLRRARKAAPASSKASPPRVVLSLVATLEPLVAQISSSSAQIATAIREHPDGEIFLSLFRSPRVITAATLLAEIGDCRARYPTRDALAGDAGQAAVAIESGKRKVAASVGRATSGCATRSTRSPTAPATGTPGPPTTTPAPSDAATTTPARSAPSAAPGAAWYGAAGKTAPPTTRPPPRPATAHHGDHPHRVGPRARPSRHPADGRRRRHPKGGPQGRAQSA